MLCLSRVTDIAVEFLHRETRHRVLWLVAAGFGATGVLEPIVVFDSTYHFLDVSFLVSFFVCLSSFGTD